MLSHRNIREPRVDHSQILRRHLDLKRNHPPSLSIHNRLSHIPHLRPQLIPGVNGGTKAAVDKLEFLRIAVAITVQDRSRTKAKGAEAVEDGSGELAFGVFGADVERVGVAAQAV